MWPSLIAGSSDKNACRYVCRGKDNDKAKMSKSLCKTKKSPKSGKSDSSPTGPDSAYICRKCDRLANKKKKLCKPVKSTLE